MTTVDYTASAAKSQKLHAREKMLGNILLLGSYFSVAIIVDISKLIQLLGKWGSAGGW